MQPKRSEVVAYLHACCRGPVDLVAITALDNMTALAINYLFFSLLHSGTLAPPFSELWDTFWETYLARSGDDQLVRVIQPFFAWRALVVASPLWYTVAATVRQSLFAFVENVLNDRVFDPWLVTGYLKR